MFKWIVKVFKDDKTSEDVVVLESKNNELASLPGKPKVDPNVETLNISREHLATLKIYKEYYNTKIVDDIYNQTEIINQIFQDNENLTFKKLDQYHYYYTENLVELLAKLKGSIDNRMSALKTKLKVIDNKVATTNKHYKKIVNDNIKDVKKSEIQYGGYMSLQLSSIYNCMLDKFNDFRFKKTYEFVHFNKKQDNDNLSFILPTDVYLDIVKFDKENQYSWDEYWIDKELMGKLQKNLFYLTYEGTFVSGGNTVEMFKISETNEFFIYNADTHTFSFLDYTKVAEYCVEANTAFYEISKTLDDYKRSQLKLKTQLDNVIKTHVTTEVKNVLKQYLTKIEDMDLLDKITTINLETKNLKSILELKQLEI